jgi:hypothetical protein
MRADSSTNDGLKNEFVRRCLKLILDSKEEETGGVMRASIAGQDHRLEIKAYGESFFVDVYPGGRVYRSEVLDIAHGGEIYSKDFVEEVVLPMLRKHMVLDDLSNV